jgi:HAD superfamily hydrolase (TIGR01509 family)
MSDAILRFTALDTAAIEVLLCDADGNLFGSEEPAFEASARVTNRLLADLGIARRFEPDELRRLAVGRNFRATALDLAAAAGIALDPAELERRVREERREVVAHLVTVLRPDPDVREPLRALGRRYRLAVVSSSALDRLAACMAATQLDELLPADRHFSAEDSLPVPASKPDPAIYALAGARLGIAGAQGLAVEDAAAGVRSAVAAGFPTVGNLQFVPPAERRARIAALREAGAAAIVPSWRHLRELLGADAAPAPPRGRRASGESSSASRTATSTNHATPATTHTAIVTSRR